MRYSNTPKSIIEKFGFVNASKSKMQQFMRFTFKIPQLKPIPVEKRNR